MKMTKSYKIVLLLTAFVLAITSAVCSLLYFEPVSAEETAATAASKYFTGLSGESEVKYSDNYLVAKIASDSKIVTEESEDGVVTTTEEGILNVKNSLAVNDLEVVFVIPDGLKTMTLVLKNDAFYANGNITAARNETEEGKPYKKVDGKYVYEVLTTISNEIEFDFVSGKATVNGEANNKAGFALDGNKLVVKTSVTDDNFMKFTVGKTETDLIATDVVDGANELLESKKVKNIDGVSKAAVKLMFELKDASVPAEVKVESIDQKASDAQENYKQTFETDDKGAITDVKVYPVVMLGESFYKNNADGSYSIIKNLQEKYSLSISVLSVLGNVANGDVYIQKNDELFWRATTEKPTALAFKKLGETSFNLVAKDGDAEVVYKTVKVDVKKFSDDTTAPEYVYNEDAYQAYLVALENAYYNHEDGHYLALGSDLSVPSLKDMVFDDVVTYEQMKKTVYYDNNASESLTSSGMSIMLSEADKYLYRVVFADGQGNAMDADKDFEADAKYEKFEFGFSIVDDAPISVEAAPVQGEGYVGSSYTASKFDIDAAGCTTTYKLMYNSDVKATAESDGWVAIPKATSVSDEAYDKDGYTYDDIKSINYNGNLTFTPNKTGSYMITCDVVSSVTARNDSASTIIRVEKQSSPVKVYTDWLENNVWTVVFLGVGTLCLIGIIVLLCIKPKEEIDD